ncbi:serine/threonine-protein kinase [Engelhardtia mirabilis]|uniref:Serine/threonine-protein kinase PknB n=1 Tax=Engelhardtia mirabilis TaxID=2528011 RepID=A0A518BGZ5_9BACT|nr:Serine/threonine-protein kinase PknB [Planctomycetes bacterium Pla133]QDV00520.1 Serine/threonine-protein kinase PknB [Planctomycetes bacterium Pla86]
MDHDELARAACLVDFLELYVADVERGSTRELEHYTRRFPGHEELVAREFEALRARSTGTAASPIPLPDLPGYRVLRELGHGGQGTVFLAEDLDLARPVALKVVRTTFGRPTATQRARFEREVGILAGLDHPGICAVYRAHLDHDPPFVAMRYVAGPTLEKLLTGDGPSGRAPSGSIECTPTEREELERLLAFFEAAARALHAAHETGILHRDVKPANIVCGDGGRPVLLDFGLARPLDDGGHHVTRTGELFGTPAYMSPEQFLELPEALDRRTDVFSLGVTLFECLTGRRPFDAPSQLQLERSIREDPLPRASRYNPSLPSELEVVLAAAMEKDVRRRYATALDLAEDLARVRERRPIHARPSSLLLRSRRWTQRNPVAAMTVLLLTLAAIGLSAALAGLSLESAKTQAALRLAESRNLAAAALTSLERDPVGALEQALASHDLEPGVHSRAALFRALADLQVERRILIPDVANAAAFSPDGGSMAMFGDRGNRLLVIDLPGGRPALDLTLPGHSQAVDVTNGATQVAIGLIDGRTLLYDRRDGYEARVLAAGEGAVRSVAFSPDGSLLACGRDDDLVHLWDTETDRQVGTLAGSLGPPCGLAFSPDGSWLASWVKELRDLPDRPDPTVRLWDVPGRRLAATLEGHQARVTMARFSADGTLLASASDDATVRVWELPAGRCKYLFQHPGSVKDLAFRPDGKELATAFDPGEPGFSESGGARVFDLADGSLRFELSGHESRAVSSIDWTADGQRIATGCYDGTARVWDSTDGRELACIRANEGIVNGVRWSASGQLFVRYKWSLSVIQPEGNVGMPRLTGHAAPIVAAAFSPGGARVATADTDGVTLVHDARSGSLLARLEAGPDAVLQLAWYDERHLLTGSKAGRCRKFDVDSGRCAWDLAVGDEPVALLAMLSYSAGFLVSSGADLFRFDLGGAGRLVFRGHAAELRCLDVSPDGAWVATGAADRSARVWDLATGACLNVLSEWLPTAYETERNVDSVLFHPDGRSLVAASQDGCVRQYRLPGGDLERSIGPVTRFGRLRWLDEGQRIACMAKWSSSIQALSLDTFQFTQVFPTVMGRMLALDTSPDRALVLTAATDGSTLLWTTEDMSAWASVKGHSGPVMSAAFSPDGTCFLTASADGTARLWPTDPAAVARAKCVALTLQAPP